MSVGSAELAVFQPKRRRTPQSSFVGRTSVTDTRHLHQQSFVVDGVYHAVVADANAPFAVSALQLLAARWAGIEGKIFQARNDARDQLAGQLLKFFRRA